MAQLIVVRLSDIRPKTGKKQSQKWPVLAPKWPVLRAGTAPYPTERPDRSRAALRHAVSDHSSGLRGLAPGGRPHSLRGDGVPGIRPPGAGDCGHQPDLCSVWHQSCVSFHKSNRQLL